MQALYRPEIPGLEHRHSGKVRELYRIDDQHTLIVATDRLSAFDVVLPDPVPGKGEALTTIANFWFARTRHLIGNHLTELPIEAVIEDPQQRAALRHRSVVVRQLHALPVEAIVRGYLAGSGWQAYRENSSICGIKLPENLPQAARLPEPIFTPTSKAGPGQHDEHIDFETLSTLIGHEHARRMRELSLHLYRHAAVHAERRGILIADSKFEFGLNADGTLSLIDELLTPDSSRLWPADRYQTGCSPPSFDKQFVRDHLETLGWNKRPPAPKLDHTVLQRTAEKYRMARQYLTAEHAVHTTS